HDVLPYRSGLNMVLLLSLASCPANSSLVEYLKRYYELQEEPLEGRKPSGLSFASKLKEMQTFFRLNATGNLDQDTMQVMRRPRCGNPDSEESSGHTQGAQWHKKVITYSIGRYTKDMPRSTVDSLLKSALSVWARASGLTFVRSHTRPADITVEFVTQEHGDSYPFDGPGGSLAHAFGPGQDVAGEMHFDDDERWTATGTSGSNLLVVAAHELGHTLGLKHSRNPASLMHPNYKVVPSGANLLSREDVSDIVALYHRRHYLSGLFPRIIRNRCAPDVTFDAVSTLGDATIFFKDRCSDDFDRALFYGPITNFMPKIETRIDAAFWVPRRSTAYLIHGNTFLQPRALCHFGFPAWVQDVDAAVHIAATGRTLFFMHDIYWSFNENRRVMDFGYPKYISEDFPALNSTINAAIHKDGFIYFFVGPQVYKYDYANKRVAGVERANSWLGC
uniref:Matrix metallopeptidase 20b (enamelysin) n=1 Tax=Hippocampus comes TaxID=109280 RepID=A0A3Q2XTJ1_HIPCM